MPSLVDRESKLLIDSIIPLLQRLLSLVFTKLKPPEIETFECDIIIHFIYMGYVTEIALTKNKTNTTKAMLKERKLQ